MRCGPRHSLSVSVITSLPPPIPSNSALTSPVRPPSNYICSDTLCPAVYRHDSALQATRSWFGFRLNCNNDTPDILLSARFLSVLLYFYLVKVNKEITHRSIFNDRPTLFPIYGSYLGLQYKFTPAGFDLTC